MNKKEINLTYGEFIKKRRSELNLLQTDLASFLNVTPQTISKYEKDECVVSFDLIGKLCKILKIDISSYFYKINSYENRLAEKYDFDDTKFTFNLKNIRNDLHIKQQTLIEEINISSSRYSNIETGKSLPTYDEFLKLATFFNLKIDYFYFGLNQTEIIVNELNNKKNDNKRNFLKSKNLNLILSLSVVINLILAISLLAIIIPTVKNSSNDQLIVDDDNKDEENNNDDKPIKDDGENNKPSDDELNDKYDNHTFNEEELSNFIFTLNEDGYHLISYKGKNKNITIPSIVNDKKVSVIESYCFANNSLIESITLSENIYYIETNAFYNLSSLKTLTLNSNIETIEEGFLINTPSLTTIKFDNENNSNSKYKIIDNSIFSLDEKILYYAFLNIKNVYKIRQGVEVISSYSFNYSSTIKNIDFNGANSLKIIKSYSFFKLSNIEKLTLNNNILKIEENAFYDLSRLKELYLPLFLKEIDGNIISYSSLSYSYLNIYLDDNNNYFEVFDNSLYSKGRKILYTFIPLKDINIYIFPSSLKEISFYSINLINNSLKGIVLPSSITNIDKYAICGNISIEFVILKDGISGLNDYSFYFNDNMNLYFESNKLPINSSDIYSFKSGDSYFKNQWYLSGDNIPILKEN